MMPFRSTLPNTPSVDEENQFTNSTIKLEDKLKTLELENVKLKKEMKDFNDKLMREVEEVKKNLMREVEEVKKNFMDELIQNLEATAEQQSLSSVKISVLQKVLYGHKKSKVNEEKLDRDCYVLMMFSPIFSVSWLLGFLTFAIQVTLGILIIDDQINSDFFGTTLSLPIKGNGTMRLAQFLTILLAIASQTDVLNGFRTLFLLRYDKEQWPKVLKKENDPSLSVWLKHVFFPNILKIVEGIIVLLATFLVILQSRRVVNLLKDYTSLFVISAVDDLVFELAGIGYFGSKLRKKTDELKEVKIGENNNKFSIYNYLLLAFTAFCMLGSWIVVINAQNRGTYVEQMYPLCPVNNTLINGKPYLSIIGDGQCQFRKGAGTNILNCGWDGSDCLILNDRYPDCEIEDPSLLGDGECNTGKYNTLLCGFDNGDCADINKAIEAIHPNCNVEIWTFVGDGICNGGEYYSEECGWDGSDCMNCTVDDMSLVGDGLCHGGAYNSKECSFDGGDCFEFNEVYPNCRVEDPSLVGDGFCHGGDYNTPECGWDGGDCVDENNVFEAKYPNCNVDNMLLVGDGVCHGGEYYSEECNFDGGDCFKFKANYPDCPVEDPNLVGDGFCHGGDYNTPECGWDGGDCKL